MQQCAALKAIFAKAFKITKKAIRYFKILHNFKFLKNSLVPIIFQDFQTLNVIMILWHLFSIRALNKDNTMEAWMQNWPDVCSIQIKRDLRGPISSPLLLLSHHAYPFLFPSSSIFLSFCLSAQSFLFPSPFPIHTPHLYTLFSYFTIWKVTQSFPSRVFADRKSIFNEVTLLLKCF